MAERTETQESRGLLARLRLRHKLALSLSIAALLPVVVASTVGVSVVLRGLDRGLRNETERQLDVGLNLLLRNIERLGQEAVRLSAHGDLSRAMQVGPGAIEEFLARESGHLPSSLIQVADERGTILADSVPHGAEGRYRRLRVTAESPAVQAGLAFENRVTIVREKDLLVVRATAPIVDASYMLQGVVVISVPLDSAFADSVKSALGTDVIISVGDPRNPAALASTFLDRLGERETGIKVQHGPPKVARGQSVLTTAEIGDRGEYAFGYTPLTDHQGQVVGAFAVAVDRTSLISAQSAAARSLALGAAGAFAFALGLAGLLSRRISRPLADLHRGSVAIARGDLDHKLDVASRDEIGDLADAFNHMTRALRENQERLAARMREIVALHDAGRAMSSSINRAQVLRKVVDSVARVYDCRLCAVWLLEPGEPGRDPELRLGAVRAKPADLKTTLRGDEGADLAAPLKPIALEVATARATLRVDRIADDKRRREAALAGGISGSLLATPLERKNQVVGVILVGRAREARTFTEADSNLLATFADQAATALENARLFDDVRQFNEELEAKVRLRTSELTAINSELGRTMTELRESQAQLILSERLAGLGLLVAGVAHEVNSPSAAIKGSVDAMEDNVKRLAQMAEELAAGDVPEATRQKFLAMVGEMAPVLAENRMPLPGVVRRLGKEHEAALTAAGLPAATAAEAGRELAQIGAGAEQVARIAELARATGAAERVGRIFTGYLMEYLYLHRNALTIRNAITKIQRIVGALKSYSHLDQNAMLSEHDVHEGIEDTLVLMDYALRDVTVSKSFAALPPVPVYADELNQVWTNLIQNAVQAMGGQGNLALETAERDGGVVVRIIDSGPGIADDVKARIFEPFFTTKPKGEGTGLGLGIVRKIVDKHRGTVTCESEPGRTCFEVWLPLGTGQRVERQVS